MDTLANVMNNYKPWADVPKFILDSPHIYDEESYAYFGKQLRKAVTFIEEVLKLKMDWDHFRDICIESNKQTRLILEFQELKKAVPVPAHPDFARQGTEISPLDQSPPGALKSPVGWNIWSQQRSNG